MSEAEQHFLTWFGMCQGLFEKACAQRDEGALVDLVVESEQIDEGDGACVHFLHECGQKLMSTRKDEASPLRKIITS